MCGNGAGARGSGGIMPNTDVHRLWLLTSLLVAGWVLYLLSPILTPFVVSALLAYLGDPLVDRLEARVKRAAAAGVP